MARVLTAWGSIVCISGVALAIGCGGHSSSNHESASGASSAGESAGSGGSSSNAGGSSAIAGSDPTSNAGTPSQADAPSGGTHAAGGHAAGGAPGAGGTMAGGGPALGGAEDAGAPSIGGNHAAGAGGANSTQQGTPAAVHAECTALCDQFQRCPDDKGNLGSSCESTCWSIVYKGNETACTVMGEDMVNCLTAADRADTPACLDAFESAIQKCAPSIAAYKDCTSAVSDPTRLPRFCALTNRSTPGQASTCIEDQRCLTGEHFNIACSNTSTEESSCSCEANGDTSNFTVNDIAPDSCVYHLCITL